MRVKGGGGGEWPRLSGTCLTGIAPAAPSACSL
eukprot:COSAG01_NODE_60123_length_296_cov_0.989848_1_plen_32_part_01